MHCYKSVVYQYLLFQEDGALFVGKNCEAQSITNMTLPAILGKIFRKMPGFAFGEEFVIKNVINGMKSVISFFQNEVNSRFI